MRLDEQKILETDFSIAIRTSWRRPADGLVLLAGAVGLGFLAAFWPMSFKILGLAGPPVACFGIIALAVSAARLALETRLYISDIGLNGEIRAFRFLKIRGWHVPRRQARQAFVRVDFSAKKPSRSLRLLLADGSVTELLHGLDQPTASRLEAKTDAILGLQNEAVGGEDLPRTAWADGLFTYPEPLAPDAHLPASDLFELEKPSADHLVVREKIFHRKRSIALAELGLLLAASVFLNGLNPLFWLLTAWPIGAAAWKIGWPKKLRLTPGELNDYEVAFRPSQLVASLVAPDRTRGLEVVSYQVLVVNRDGDRRAVWRDLPLEEAHFLAFQIKTWYKMGDEPALAVIKKNLEKA